MGRTSSDTSTNAGTTTPGAELETSRGSGYRLAAKRALCRAIAGLGPRIVTATGRRWLCERIVPLVLDDTVVERRLTARPLRRGNVSVLCDPHLHTHRPLFWCGVLYEEAVERFIRRHVGAGDTFIDVGSNLGHISAVAACAVGTGGRVLSFEANPRLVEMTRRHFASEGLVQIDVFGVGLGDREARRTLRIDPVHRGHSTLRPPAAGNNGDRRMTESVECEVRVGDRVLAAEPTPGRVFLKLDVEGFEREVLRGLRDTLRDRVSCALVEVTPAWLGGVQGVEQLFELMHAAGLSGRRLTPGGRTGAPVNAGEIERQQNVLFIRE